MMVSFVVQYDDGYFTLKVPSSMLFFDARSVIKNNLCNDGNTSDDIKQNLSLFREFLRLILLHIEMLRGIHHGDCCIILIVVIICDIFSLSVPNFSYPTDMIRATKGFLAT